jgi:general secretion pathway protein J
MKDNGFTLVELLVGLFLFGLMAAAGAMLAISGADASAQATRLVDEAGAITRLRALLMADALQAAPRPWRDAAGAVQPAFAMRSGTLFTLVRRGWANPAGAPRAELQRVTWQLDRGQLLRRAAPMIDGTDDGAATVLLNGVERAQLRLWVGGRWQDAAGAADPTALPAAIELTLEGARIGRLRQVVPVAAGGAP